MIEFRVRVRFLTTKTLLSLSLSLAVRSFNMVYGRYVLLFFMCCILCEEWVRRGWGVETERSKTFNTVISRSFKLILVQTITLVSRVKKMLSLANSRPEYIVKHSAQWSIFSTMEKVAERAAELLVLFFSLFKKSPCKFSAYFLSCERLGLGRWSTTRSKELRTKKKKEKMR